MSSSYKYNCPLCSDETNNDKFICKKCINNDINIMNIEVKKLDNYIEPIKEQIYNILIKEKNKTNIIQDLRIKLLEPKLIQQNKKLRKQRIQSYNLSQHNNIRRQHIATLLHQLAQKNLNDNKKKLKLLQEKNDKAKQIISLAQQQLISKMYNLRCYIQKVSNNNTYYSYTISNIPLIDAIDSIFDIKSIHLSTYFNIYQITNTALGNCVLLLTLLSKYLSISYPYPMKYNASTSIIYTTHFNNLKKQNKNVTQPYLDDDETVVINKQEIYQSKNHSKATSSNYLTIKSLPLYWQTQSATNDLSIKKKKKKNQQKILSSNTVLLYQEQDDGFNHPQNFQIALKLLHYNIKYIASYLKISPKVIKMKFFLQNLYIIMQRILNPNQQEFQILSMKKNQTNTNDNILKDYSMINI